MVAARVMHQVVSKWNALKIKLVLSTMQKTEEALIDSGATECFLDHRTVSWLWLPSEPLKVPQTIHNINGTHNQAGHITHKCWLKVQLGTIHQEMDFFITNLGQDRIVLGYPFLKLFNPNINWTKGNLTQTSTVSIVKSVAGLKWQYVKGLLIPFSKRALWVHLYSSYTLLYRDNWVAAW